MGKKIAISREYGGFSVSRECALKLREKGVNITLDGEYFSDGSGPRTGGDSMGYHIGNEDFGIESKNWNAYRADERLIEAIEEVGEEESSGNFASIKIVEIPDDVEFTIEEYDGLEWVAEKHRTWR